MALNLYLCLLLIKRCSGFVFPVAIDKYIAGHNNGLGLFSGFSQIPLYQKYFQSLFHVGLSIPLQFRLCIIQNVLNLLIICIRHCTADAFNN